MLKKGKIRAKSLKTKVCKRRVRFISLKFRPLQLRYPNPNQHPESSLPGLRTRLCREGNKPHVELPAPPVWWGAAQNRRF